MFLAEILREESAAVKCEILESNGDFDHFHFILETPPTVSLASTIGRLKSLTAKRLIDQFGGFLRGDLQRTLWSSGYFVASTGGVTLETLKTYVANQCANPP
jgi:putative transposase